MSKGRKRDDYEQRVSLQEDNHEARGSVENQNKHTNVRKQALGPNTRRGK